MKVYKCLFTKINLEMSPEKQRTFGPNVLISKTNFTSVYLANTWVLLAKLSTARDMIVFEQEVYWYSHIHVKSHVV